VISPQDGMVPYRGDFVREAKMPKISQWFFRTAVVFLIFSIAAGLQMSISGVHNVTGAHAHAGLLGWATSAIFGTYYALDPAKATTRLAYTQFWIFTIAAVVMSVALYLMLLGYEGLAPVVAAGSILSFVGVLIFAFVVFAPSSPRL
jgi:cbb3-type cytochrome oxidase subunit 1